MDLCGSVHANLRAAVLSARRLKDGPVHPDTVDYWGKLWAVARAEDVAMASYKTRELMNDLQRAIDARGNNNVEKPTNKETF